LIALPHPRGWPLWDLLFPRICNVCGREVPSGALPFCAQCWADAPTADVRDLRVLEHVDRVAVGYRFSADDVVRASVHTLKYDGMRPLARVMAERLMVRLPTRYLDPEMVWTDVPLHWLRQWRRGFNQSRLIAQHLAALTGHAEPVRLLRRVRPTPSQTARTYRERSANVRNAFVYCGKSDAPERVVLIDDVVTTGATVNECARTLKAAGVEWVGVLSFSLAQHP
jgi:ComF family protein